ncbi:DUF1754-domain-containing protein [Rhodofomes roseus]|uniref:DUF1754-domain-containing protein n=1 Tax=Rhodofomes roseus TaxID=34475 RepID=A0A4Y9Z7Z6_9APHY|nr:DUF1754-domain-containing protein [Rhodofomes roseus]KAH9836934.1 DUF1754-domain-containing protein [Rhodofomes roseus]TFY69983.1 hypothetical protein EVJ58_g106 [Rhodofomes roseus]
MSDYDFRTGGSLKLRGVAEGGIVKKKKHKSKSKDKEREKNAESELVTELESLNQEEAAKIPSSSGSGRNSPAIASSSDRKTAAERRFEEVQRKRLAARVAKQANKTHKDRVHEFNSKLEALSEHHDIPKVGPG